MIYNYWCLDCNYSFTKDTLKKEIQILRDKDLKFNGIICPFCCGKAKIMGKPSIAVITGEAFMPVAVMEDKYGKQYEKTLPNTNNSSFQYWRL